MTEYTIEYIKKNNLILLEVISGSHAYGLNTDSSDKDIRGIFLMKEDHYLGLKYVEQINDEKNDITYYELKRFLQLALQNNPNILELFGISGEHILYKHPLFDLLKPEDFLSKQCRNTFGGYAISQIKKARGLNKKIVNPVDEERKTPLDFCYVIDNDKSYPLDIFLSVHQMEQRFCGLVNIPNSRDVYSLFYDQQSHDCFSKEYVNESTRKSNIEFFKSTGKIGLGFKGILKEDENGEFHSNELRLSSIPKGRFGICVFSYNKDGYSQYCKDYKEYWDWVDKRNPERYKTNIEHDKNYDSKNLMHCYRLLQMAKEIALGEGIIVKRPNRDFLLSIRNGDLKYDHLVDGAEKMIKELDELFEKSDLPKKPKVNKINDILVYIRKEFNK